MKEYAFFVYHRKDDNILETCLSSLHAVKPSIRKVVITDGVPSDVLRYCSTHFNVAWINVPSKQMQNRRATCKIELLKGFIDGLEDGDRVVVSDVDVYYKGDPFTAFEEHPKLDLGLTTRGYAYAFPINGGMFFIAVSDVMRDWAAWHVREIHNPVWPPYVSIRRKWKHERFGLDWTVGQDFLIANWEARDAVLHERKVNVVDVGPHYNYCPPTDLLGPEAFTRIRDALADNTTVVLHLKSDLKRMIYEKDLFPNVSLRHPVGNLAWL